MAEKTGEATAKEAAPAAAPKRAREKRESGKRKAFTQFIKLKRIRL